MIENGYKIIDGIKCYAPELAIENKNFQSEGFEFLFNVEEKNFWFRSRNRIIRFLFEKYLGTDMKKNILEIGCGTGYVLNGLSRFKNYKLTGAEIHLEGLKFAKRRLLNVDFIQLDATNLPFNNDFDAIGTFDVLEHIDEDELVMRNVYSSLKSKGLFFITVPQYQFMWSIMDDTSYHKRRYSRKELITKVKSAGFTVEYAGSFVTTLFPAMLTSRLLKKKAKEGLQVKPSEHTELELNSFVNNIFERLMRVDEFFIKAGASLPFGGSLILVAKKN